MKKKIVVAMSGGVDSSVCALLLQEQGYEVEGLFVKNWDYGELGSSCPNRIEFEDAKKVGKILGINVVGRDFIKEYQERVFTHFIKGLEKGLTPNPDILCNKEMKFNVFMREVKAMNSEIIATGHYAKIEKINDEYILAKPKDNDKDQTYFLHALNQKQLSNAMFPLADLTKKEVRNIARENNLPVSEKKDSTGICFIGKQKFDTFISNYIKRVAGDIIDDTGKIVGRHTGLAGYTIGQRKGLGIGGGHSKDDSPWYVAKKDIKENKLLVVQDTNHPYLMQKIIKAQEFQYISSIKPKINDKLFAQIRYRQKAVLCVVKDIFKDNLIVEFDKPQRASTSGQYLVIYKDDYCLGGGIIY
jgi:tRNA-specific 2-thiouridylase